MMCTFVYYYWKEKRKAEEFHAKSNLVELPKKKRKVKGRISCQTCHKAQGKCSYIGWPGHLDQNGYRLVIYTCMLSINGKCFSYVGSV